MDNRGIFIKSAFLLAVSNIALRCASLSFNAYVSAKLGSESMGLLTLVMSVYSLALTLACSGVNLAAVRITAERCAALDELSASRLAYCRTVRGVIASCALYSFIFAALAAILLFFAAPFIGERLLHDGRTVSSLRVLALSLAPISLGAVFSGCFTALRKVYKNAAVALTEQAVKICVISTCLAAFLPRMQNPVEFSCLAVVGGTAVSEGLSLIMNVLLYLFDSKRPAGSSAGKATDESIPTHLGDVASTALPVAVGAYARQGLSSAEHLCVPWGMRKSGLSSSSSLAAYGELQGMAFPMLLFPSAVLSSATGLLIPELARLCTQRRVGEISSLVSRVLSLSLMFSLGTSSLFLFYGGALGRAVYGSESVGRMLSVCAPLIPVMYTDTAVDCMLKGLGEQLACMRINIIDSAAGLVLTLVLVPVFGVGGYIASVYFCELLNFALSLRRLKRRVHSVPRAVGALTLPALLSLVSLATARLAARRLFLSESAQMISFSIVYVAGATFCSVVAAKRKKAAANIQK